MPSLVSPTDDAPSQGDYRRGSPPPLSGKNPVAAAPGDRGRPGARQPIAAPPGATLERPGSFDDAGAGGTPQNREAVSDTSARAHAFWNCASTAAASAVFP